MSIPLSTGQIIFGLPFLYASETSKAAALGYMGARVLTNINPVGAAIFNAAIVATTITASLNIYFAARNISNPQTFKMVQIAASVANLFTSFAAAYFVTNYFLPLTLIQGLSSYAIVLIVPVVLGFIGGGTLHLIREIANKRDRPNETDEQAQA